MAPILTRAGSTPPNDPYKACARSLRTGARQTVAPEAERVEAQSRLQHVPSRQAPKRCRPATPFRNQERRRVAARTGRQQEMTGENKVKGRTQDAGRKVDGSSARETVEMRCGRPPHSTHGSLHVDSQSSPTGMIGSCSWVRHTRWRVLHLSL